MKARMIPTENEMRKQAVEAALRREHDESAEKNARLRLELLERLEADAKQVKGPRRELILPVVSELVAKTRADFKRYDVAAKALDRAEPECRKAASAVDAAFARRAEGTIDAREALERQEAYVVAEAAEACRFREFTELRRAARLPVVNVPREAQEAEASTRALAVDFVEHGADFSHDHHRPSPDVRGLAYLQGRLAPAIVAWFSIFELRELAGLEDRCKARGKERTRADLEQLFAVRWGEFERIEGLPPAQRERERTR
ncbi:MAG: hypothetical protein IPM35_04225 [Myxococcales bacterium]|nr:hypothetical protein [Myxococcales bacterium]